MRRLIKNIEQVLYREECVVIPGVGAFLRHNASASIDGGKGLIYPGHSHLSFNAALQQNDGVLVRQYMSVFSMGYKKALSLLESDIHEFREDLQRNGLIQMGSIGRLTFDRTDGRLNFLPNPEHPYSVDFYGLMPVAKLAEIEVNAVAPVAPKAGKKSDIFYLPINLRTLRYGTAAAVLALAVLLTPAKKLSFPDQASQYQAGFLLPQRTEVASPSTSEVQPTIQEPKLTSTETIGGLPLVKPEEGVSRYYIVIASLKSKTQVEKFIEAHQPLQRFSGAGVLVTASGMHRIFTGVYDSKEAAQAELQSHVATEADFESAWIYERN